ncbi:MAG: winged helix-turn-helix domain-containing protein [Natrialbaceae archaeon]|nr:winged helix-turn-helix domain-containing protein [Natrialbaceae archaeon]
MADDQELTHPWSGDVNQAALDDWIDSTTAFDRVRAVIDTTAEPVFAREIAEQASVAEPTARRHLDSLVDAGRVTAVPAESGTKYKRAAGAIALRRVAGLHAQYSKEDLHNAIVDLRDELAGLREEYGVSNAADLATELDIEADGWTALSRMRDLESNLDIAKAALNLYDFDPDGRDTPDQSDDGSLAGFGGYERLESGFMCRGEDVDGALGPLDVLALEEIRAALTGIDGLIDTVGFQSLVDPEMVQMAIRDGIGEATDCRFDIRWYRGGYYSIHHTDSTGRDFRWDYHPKVGAPDRHFHPPPDAPSDTVEPSCVTATRPAVVARAVHKLWRRAYDTGRLDRLNSASGDL